MSKFWYLRDEIYKSLHQWPLLMALSILGCLIGWAIASLLPSDYKATMQVYVALNPYRTYSDTKFLALAKPKYSYLDDYKNWQMSELESAVYLEEFIQETLTNLRQLDPYWEEIEPSELRFMLEADWRSAGTWSLTAQADDAERASQAVKAWSNVVLWRVENAVLSARNLFMIEQEMEALANQQLETATRLEELAATKEFLTNFLEQTKGSQLSETLDKAAAWRAYYLTARLAEFTPVWMDLLEAQPAPGTSLEDYIKWINQAIALIDSEYTVLLQRSADLETQRNDLAERYALESRNSLGLSPNLEIEGIAQLAPYPIQSPGGIILVGGAVGLLSWAFLQTIMVTKRLQHLESA